MYMPRMTALAEALWTGRPEQCDSYLQRMPGHYTRMDAMKINYRLPDLPGLLNNYTFTQEYALRIPAPVRNMTVCYTQDGSRPMPGSPELPAPLVIRNNTRLRVAAFSPSGCHGDIYELNFTRQPMLMALTAIQADSLLPGLACNYYKASFKSTKPMARAKADSSFTYGRIAVPATVQAPAFGITYRGYIDVPADGTYSFYLTCDDGGGCK
jgi:hexosaminidase